METELQRQRNEVYTSSQAREILGVGSSSFKNLVDRGEIRKITPPGKKQSLYLKEDVDRIVQAKKQFGDTAYLKRRSVKEDVEETEGETDWIQESDLPYLLAYDLEMYGIENTVDISITHAWWKKNPYMCRILYDKRDRRNIWGAITVMPMKEETIFRLLRREMQVREITPDDILVYEAGKKYYGYVPSATIKPEHRPHFRKLLQSMFDYWCEQYPNVQIIKFYAFTASEEGLDLMKHLFFSPRYDLGEEAFELDPYQRNPSKLLKTYQNCIRNKEKSLPKT